MTVVEIFQKYIPNRHKKTPSGWTSFNAACCHHRGHSHDNRQRAGVIFSDGLVYHCFNCGYTASWKPGLSISNKLKNLMKWMGANDDDVNRMVFEALKTEASNQPEVIKNQVRGFNIKDLPEGSLPILEWAQADLDHNQEQQLANVIQYIADRGFDPVRKEFYWTPEASMADRLIIPFTYESKIVGWTARRIVNSKPKYLSDQHPNYVFNIDSITYNQEYVFVVEGPFDALAIQGLGILRNEISSEQAQLINNLGKTVIVIPDQDRPGGTMINQAAELGWSVAFPNWETDVKDAAEAVQRYGKLFVIVDSIKTAETGKIKIALAKKRFDAKIKAQKNAE